MDRYAVFVDAGYVYAAGGALVLDTVSRTQVNLDHAAFIGRLRSIIDTDFPQSGDFLRIYWYDAAPRGVAQAEHDRIADHPGVKVRLGRLTRQGQKGVDSLVLRDMMRLASEHAICTAFLVAGDEDLRQGVIEAQDYGVKVLLLGVEPTFGQNQAEPLVREADELRVLTFEELHDCFARVHDDTHAVVLADGLDAYAIGFDAGEGWAPSANPAGRRAVIEHGRLPQEADVELIRRLLDLGDLPRTAQLPDSVLSEARDGFRAGVEKATTAGDDERAAESAPGAPTLPGPTGPLPVPERPGGAPEGMPMDQVWAFSEGNAFGRTWLDAQPQDEVRYVRANFPYLPRDIDVDLLHHLVREMGLPEGAFVEDGDRRSARAGFWQALGMELDLGARRSQQAGYEPIAERDPVAFGRAFARQWIARSSAEEIERARNLIEKRIGLPSDADAALLRLAAVTLGDPVPVDVKHRLRDGFKDGLESGAS